MRHLFFSYFFLCFFIKLSSDEKELSSFAFPLNKHLERYTFRSNIQALKSIFVDSVLWGNFEKLMNYVNNNNYDFLDRCLSFTATQSKLEESCFLCWCKHWAIRNEGQRMLNTFPLVAQSKTTWQQTASHAQRKHSSQFMKDTRNTSPDL